MEALYSQRQELLITKYDHFWTVRCLSNFQHHSTFQTTKNDSFALYRSHVFSLHGSSYHSKHKFFSSSEGLRHVFSYLRTQQNRHVTETETIQPWSQRSQQEMTTCFNNDARLGTSEVELTDNWRGRNSCVTINVVLEPRPPPVMFVVFPWLATHAYL
jgi:hypothetical protein